MTDIVEVGRAFQTALAFAEEAIAANIQWRLDPRYIKTLCEEITRLRQQVSDRNAENTASMGEIASLRKEVEEARAHYEKNLAQIATLVEVCGRHGLKDEALSAIRALK